MKATQAAQKEHARVMVQFLHAAIQALSYALGHAVEIGDAPRWLRSLERACGDIYITKRRAQNKYLGGMFRERRKPPRIER